MQKRVVKVDGISWNVQSFQHILKKASFETKNNRTSSSYYRLKCHLSGFGGHKLDDKHYTKKQYDETWLKYTVVFWKKKKKKRKPDRLTSRIK